jgi:ribosome-associated protein
MGAMLESNKFALALAKLLHQEKASQVRLLDVSSFCDWTRYVVLATVQSKRQMSGLVDTLEEFLAVSQKERLNKRPALDSDWAIWDCGDTVVHLFLPETRAYYDLDRLYHDSRVIDEFT